MNHLHIYKLAIITRHYHMTESTTPMHTGSDNDYNSSLLDITISPSTPSMGECISSTILPDGTPEGNESFTLTLIENGMVNLSPTMSQTQIVIVNDDGMFEITSLCCVSFLHIH